MIENFIYEFNIDTSICDNLIKYHQNNSEYRLEGEILSRGNVCVDKNIKDSVDVTFFNPSNNSTIKKYFSELAVGFHHYLEKYNLTNVSLNTEICSSIQYYPPGGGYKVWHYERGKGTEKRQLVYMTYLNDVPNGGTEWYYQNYKTEAVKGLTVIWPSDFTHTHRGIVSPDNEKWIVTGWFEYT